jgi:Cu2+-exporting ATPase
MLIELALLGSSLVFLRKRKKTSATEPSIKDSIKKKFIKKNKLNQLTKKVRTFLQEEVRQQQMQEFSNSDNALAKEEKRMKRRFSFASATLGLSGLSLFYPIFVVPTVGMLIYVAIPFYKLAYNAAVKERRISSYVIDTILITGILLKGLFFLGALDLWAMTLGRRWLLKSEHSSKKHLLNLFDDTPPAVWILTGAGIELEIPFEDLKYGDVLVVSAGQIIPVDGVIVEGVASIDQYKLTGESQPAEKTIDDAVLAATVILSGKVHIRTEKTGKETVAMKIGETLNATADYKNSMQSRGEAIADGLVVPTLGASLLAFPLLGAGSALAVLTNTFGYKMRLFAPASMLTFLNMASQQGILIKDGRSLEALNQITTVVFDKTGTLTLDQPTVGKLHTYNGIDKKELLTYAAMAEAGQSHPIAKAILTAADQLKLSWNKIEDAEYKIGYGIQVIIAGQSIRVGSSQFMAQEGISLSADLIKVQQACLTSGNSLVMVALGEQIAGAIELHATVRPEAKEIIDYFHQRNISTHIISGDYDAPTKQLADKLGIKHYSAGVLPENKAKQIKELQLDGQFVCFIGDGINDSIALKQANVSISLKGATTIATDTAQIIMMDGGLKKLSALFELSSSWEQNMKRNFHIATIPSAICLGGIFFFNWGLVIGLLITQGALFAGLYNTVLPLMKQNDSDNNDDEVQAPNHLPPFLDQDQDQHNEKK